MKSELYIWRMAKESERLRERSNTCYMPLHHTRTAVHAYIYAFCIFLCHKISLYPAFYKGGKA